MIVQLNLEKDEVSEVITREVLRPEDGKKKKVDKKMKQATYALFKKMVEESDKLFSQSAAKIGVVSYSIRGKVGAVHWIDEADSVEAKLMQHLRNLYAP